MICPDDYKPCNDDLCRIHCIRTGTRTLGICQECKEPDELNGVGVCSECWNEIIHPGTDDYDRDPIRIVKIRPDSGGQWQIILADEKGLQSVVDIIRDTEPDEGWEIIFEDIGPDAYNNLPEFNGW